MNCPIGEEGAPAFPCDRYDFQPHSGNQVIRDQFFGMSLLDWFAGQALAGLCAQQHYRTYDSPNLQTLDEWRANLHRGDAAACYAKADAMLAEREGRAK